MWLEFLRRILVVLVTSTLGVAVSEMLSVEIFHFGIVIGRLMASVATIQMETV